MSDKRKADERECPSCGEVHASSLVPGDELGHYAEGATLAELLEADVARYRVFVCADAFHVRPHVEE